MAFSVTSPVTGGTQTGLTSPTYTTVSDIAPDANGRQVAVTALGGTQTGVNVHSIAAPFTNTFVRPRVLKTLGKPNPVTGVINSVPRNTFKLITRHGVMILVGQPYQTMNIVTTYDVPAGSDLADPANIRACCSLHHGVTAQQSAGIGDTLVSGIV